ncbi:MAG: LemA family protein [Spirochaetes bacterium]|jgi:LemA protein|nr:LemA family protein [Spirochaetota bacterium]
MTTIYIILVAAGFFIFFCILIVNGLIAKKNQVRNAEGSIDALLKKRFDLIPNLVETVKKYMKHERETLSAVTGMRTKTLSPGLTADERDKINAQLERALGSIMLTAEQYPDLKASSNFIQLQAALNETEEQISAARRAFNASVTDYNNALEMFPSNVFAALLRYKHKEVFTAAEEEKENVSVKKLFES